MEELTPIDEIRKIAKDEKTLTLLDDVQQKNELGNVVGEALKETNDIKGKVDILATASALSKQENINKVVEEKAEELRNDAEAKRVHAEKARIEEETKKAVAEKEKRIAEYDKVIAEKEKEVQQLKVEADKSQAFFDSNKDILKYIGIREKKSIGTMQALMFPATIVFIVVQIILFPLTLCGLVLETIVNIIGGICGSIKNNALKIVLSILVIALIVGVGFCAYYFGGKAISNL